MINFNISILNPEECYILNQRLISLLKEELPKEASVGKVLPRLKELDEDLAAIMAKVNGSEKTAELAERDAARDDAYTGFRDICDAFTKTRDPIKLAAAKKLVALLRDIGWSLQNEGYTEETAKMKTLLKTLETPEYAEAVKAIAAIEWVEALKKTEADFEATEKLRNELYSQDDIPTTRECKAQMSDYLKPMIIYIDMMNKVDPGTYATAQSKIAEALESIMTVARARSTRKINERNDEEKTNS